MPAFLFFVGLAVGVIAGVPLGWWLCGRAVRYLARRGDWRITDRDGRPLPSVGK